MRFQEISYLRKSPDELIIDGFRVCTVSRMQDRTQAFHRRGLFQKRNHQQLRKRRTAVFLFVRPVDQTVFHIAVDHSRRQRGDDTVSRVSLRGQSDDLIQI